MREFPFAGESAVAEIMPARAAAASPPVRSAPAVRSAPSDGGETSFRATRWIWPGSPVIPLTMIATLLTITVVGLPYYLAPVAERVRSPLHPWLKPTGYIGQGAGVLTLLLMAFMWMYPLRKKFRRLEFTGSIARWLDVHILCGLAIPWLGALHAAWRFDGLIGLGYGAMLLVCLSGIVGKYLYAHIPRTRSGVELTLEQVQARRRELIERVASATGRRPEEVVEALADATPVLPSRGRWGSFVGLIAIDFLCWKAAHNLRRKWSGLQLSKSSLRQIVRLARSQIALTQRLRMLDLTQRVFRFWHVAHRPVAISASLAVGIHVTVAVALGVTWFL